MTILSLIAAALLLFITFYWIVLTALIKQILALLREHHDVYLDYYRRDKEHEHMYDFVKAVDIDDNQAIIRYSAIVEISRNPFYPGKGKEWNIKLNNNKVYTIDRIPSQLTSQL